MNRPKEIQQAIIAIWLTIIISVLAELANRWAGNTSVSEFVAVTAFLCLFCLFPYKIAKGSNRARWLYCILVALSFILMLGGVVEGMTKIDWISMVLFIPLEIFIVIKLFQPNASNWFETRGGAQYSRSS